jgi:hypothetical protein
MKPKSAFVIIPALLCVVALGAAQPPTTIKLPLSHVETVDTTNMVFVVTKDSTNLSVRYTAKTKFFIGKMPAVSKDAEAADHVSGILRATTNGVPEAVRINIVKLAPK